MKNSEKILNEILKTVEADKHFLRRFKADLTSFAKEYHNEQLIVKPSYLQLKDKETKVFEDWALKQGYYVEKYKWFDIAGDGINYYTIVNRYKRKFKL